jgi:hypothetical protein
MSTRTLLNVSPVAAAVKVNVCPPSVNEPVDARAAAFSEACVAAEVISTVTATEPVLPRFAL